jgi:hypothetical protein
MRKLILISIASCALLALSCNDDQVKPNDVSNSEAVNNNTNINSLTETASSTDDSFATNTPVTSTNATTSNTIESNPFADLKGNNPEHGQPNHRCDIPVGAPLNTPPQNAMQVSNTPTTAPPPTSQPTNIQNAPMQNPMPIQTTAPGFSGKPNPEHGQPGHRCDLEVGQILP